MCLAYSLVSLSPGPAPAGWPCPPPHPLTALLPQPARQPGAASSLQWAAGAGDMATAQHYAVRVLRQGDDPVQLYSSTEPQHVLCPADSDTQDPPPKKKKLYETGDNKEQPCKTVENVAWPRADSIKRVLDDNEQQISQFLVANVSEEVCEFLKKLVRKLRLCFTEELHHLNALKVFEDISQQALALQSKRLLKYQNPMQLSELPDDILLEVLARLSPWDLLRSARAVDRRWRALALHPAVWQHRHMRLYTAYDEPDEPRSTGKLAMRLAPCLGSLEIRTNTIRVWSGGISKQRAPPAVVVSSCNCAVSHLDLHVDGHAMTYALAEKLLRRQADLGRLRSAKLELYSEAWRNAAKLRALLLALDACDLSSLSLDNVTKSCLPSGWFSQRERRPLRSLSFLSRHASEPLLEALLAAHQASLEYAEVPNADGAALRLLSRCARLREANVPFEPELGELLKNRTLTALHLDFSSFGTRPDPNASVRTVDFFKESVHLKSLRFCADHEDVGSKVLDEIKYVGAALASSGRSLLETLAIEPGDSPQGVEQLALPSWLPGLPHLHTLVLTNEVDASFLTHFDASSTPNLRVLRFTSLFDPCSHCFTRLSPRTCKFAFVRDLLHRLPMVHVGNVLPVHRCDRFAGCDCCLQGLHTEVRLQRINDSDDLTSNRDYWKGRGLYAHDSGQPCGLHHSTLIWVRLGAEAVQMRNEASGSNSE